MNPRTAVPTLFLTTLLTGFAGSDALAVTAQSTVQVASVRATSAATTGVAIPAARASASGPTSVGVLTQRRASGG